MESLRRLEWLEQIYVLSGILRGKEAVLEDPLKKIYSQQQSRGFVNNNY